MYYVNLQERFIWVILHFRLILFWFLSARMDPALLRERELFKKRALSTPAVEKKPAASDSGSHKKKKPKLDKDSSSGSKHSTGRFNLLSYPSSALSQ